MQPGKLCYLFWPISVSKRDAIMVKILMAAQLVKLYWYPECWQKIVNSWKNKLMLAFLLSSIGDFGIFYFKTVLASDFIITFYIFMTFLWYFENIQLRSIPSWPWQIWWDGAKSCFRDRRNLWVYIHTSHEVAFTDVLSKYFRHLRKSARRSANSR